MDWSNEAYVRVYVRDTTTWLRLGWDGQNVLTQVLRKLDLSGVMDIGSMEPWEAVTVHCRAPEDAARAGMEACLRLGVLQHNGPWLVAPNYREAQEACKSDKQRQKESRARRHAAAVTNRDEASQGVTPESRAVTGGHAESQSVTLCVTDTDTDTDAVRSPAGAREMRFDQGPEPGSISGSIYARRYLEETTRQLDWRLHREAFAAIDREAAGDRDAIAKSLRGFWADPWAVGHGWPPKAWAKQFGRHLDGPRATAPTSIGVAADARLDENGKLVEPDDMKVPLCFPEVPVIFELPEPRQ